MPLPSWASDIVENGNDKILVNVGSAYPLYLRALNIALDQYGAEVALRCILADLRLIKAGPVWVKLSDSPGWALNRLRVGKGAEQGVKDYLTLYQALLDKRANTGSTGFPI